MEELLNDTNEYTKKIKETNVYKKFIVAKKNLESEPDLMSRVDEFRKSSFQIQIAHNYGFYNSYEQMVNLKNENDELLSHPQVKAFIDAEYKMTQMMSEIFNQIVESVDFDMDFLE